MSEVWRYTVTAQVLTDGGVLTEEFHADYDGPQGRMGAYRPAEVEADRWAEKVGGKVVTKSYSDKVIEGEKK
jgi:hypothetical protein